MTRNMVDAMTDAEKIESLKKHADGNGGKVMLNRLGFRSLPPAMTWETSRSASGNGEFIQGTIGSRRTEGKQNEGDMFMVMASERAFLFDGDISFGKKADHVLSLSAHIGELSHRALQAGRAANESIDNEKEVDSSAVYFGRTEAEVEVLKTLDGVDKLPSLKQLPPSEAIARVQAFAKLRAGPGPGKCHEMKALIQKTTLENPEALPGVFNALMDNYMKFQSPLDYHRIAIAMSLFKAVEDVAPGDKATKHGLVRNTLIEPLKLQGAPDQKAKQHADKCVADIVASEKIRGNIRLMLEPFPAMSKWRGLVTDVVERNPAILTAKAGLLTEAEFQQPRFQ
ncbi:MAG: hypothetical protein ABW032_05905 [Burkholderiaceae bacterium]